METYQFTVVRCGWEGTAAKRNGFCNNVRTICKLNGAAVSDRGGIGKRRRELASHKCWNFVEYSCSDCAMQMQFTLSLKCASFAIHLAFPKWSTRLEWLTTIELIDSCNDQSCRRIDSRKNINNVKQWNLAEQRRTEQSCSWEIGDRLVIGGNRRHLMGTWGWLSVKAAWWGVVIAFKTLEFQWTLRKLKKL